MLKKLDLHSEHQEQEKKAFQEQIKALKEDKAQLEKTIGESKTDMATLRADCDRLARERDEGKTEIAKLTGERDSYLNQFYLAKRKLVDLEKKSKVLYAECGRRTDKQIKALKEHVKTLQAAKNRVDPGLIHRKD